MTIHIPLTIGQASSTDFTLEGEGRQLVHFKDSGTLARLVNGSGIFARHDLLRWAAPLALAPQGLVALHASAVHKEGITLGFLGIGGAGKSTLAWELGRRGWEPIADDLMVCDAAGRVNVLAERLLRQWCNDQAAKIDVSTWIDYSDLARQLSEPHHQRWLPISGLWFLDEIRGPSLAIRPLSGGDHFRRLVQYGFGGLPTPAAWAHQFQVYAALAGRVPAAILQVPEGLDELRSALPQLEDNLAQRLKGGQWAVDNGQQKNIRPVTLPEEQVILLAAARSELGPDHRERIHSASRQEVDWDGLWELARSHGVGYFVGRHLLQLNNEPNNLLPIANWSLPTALVQRIQEGLRQETARALALREYQLRLNAEFERAKLAALWLKGLVLAERLYGRYEARHCGDLDILVEKAQVPRAEKILAGLGFEPYHPSLPGQEFHPLADHHAMWCLRLGDDWLLIVELHHRLSGPPTSQPSIALLFQESRTVDFQGQATRIPSLEQELLILCLHAHHHHYSLLRCLMDVAEFVKCNRSQLNWPKLVRDARACYCLGRLRAALEITEAVLGLDSAQDIFCQLPGLTARQRWACRRLPLMTLLDPATQNDDRRQAQLALLMDRWSDVFRLVGRRLLPAKEHVRTICPAFLAPYPALPRMYYFFHAFKRLAVSVIPSGAKNLLQWPVRDRQGRSPFPIRAYCENPQLRRRRDPSPRSG